MEQTPLFGATIAHDCRYCNHNAGTEDLPRCRMTSADVDLQYRLAVTGTCSEFSYNPLLRPPRERPKQMEFSMEDFLL